MILFIYGTLKRGHKAHHLLKGQQLLGEAVTEPHYRIVDLGPHPALVECEAGLACHGELWEVNGDCLSKLDEYEDAPRYYILKPVIIQDHRNTVEAYFPVFELEPNLPYSDRWPREPA